MLDYRQNSGVSNNTYQTGITQMARAKPGERTQKDMVVEILNGGVEKPSEIVNAVKEKFGVSIARGNVNQIKIGWKKAKSAPAAAVRKPRATPTKPVSGVSVGNRSKLDAVNAVLMLCEKFGADKAGEIIEALKTGKN
jgi:hypothetical protein